MKKSRNIVLIICIAAVATAGYIYAQKSGWFWGKGSKISPSTSSQPTAIAVPGTNAKPSVDAGATTASYSNTVSPSRIAEAEKLYDTGFQIYMSRKYDQAIKYFDEAIQKDPNCYKAYNAKGIALCFKGNYPSGMNLIKKSLSIKPDFAYANFNMGLAYKLMKDYKSAIKWFDTAIGYDPKDTWSYFGKACIYAEWNNVADAVDNLKKAIETDPTVKITAQKEPDLDNIKGTPEYIRLISER